MSNDSKPPQTGMTIQVYGSPDRDAWLWDWKPIVEGLIEERMEKEEIAVKMLYSSLSGPSRMGLRMAAHIDFKEPMTRERAGALQEDLEQEIDQLIRTHVSLFRRTSLKRYRDRLAAMEREMSTVHQMLDKMNTGIQVAEQTTDRALKIKEYADTIRANVPVIMRALGRAMELYENLIGPGPGSGT